MRMALIGSEVSAALFSCDMDGSHVIRSLVVRLDLLFGFLNISTRYFCSWDYYATVLGFSGLCYCEGPVVTRLQLRFITHYQRFDVSGKQI